VTFAILQTEIQNFINENLDSNIFKLAFQKNAFPDVERSEIINQIACKNKAKTKFPVFFETENIIYPSKISIEQTSSYKTAIYKSEIVASDSILDATGGFGIDAYYFSEKVKKVVHCEINASLSKIVAQNFFQLKSKNIACFEGDSCDYLEKNNATFDWIYIDPSRRNNTKGKVFMLKDCLPNVPDLLPFYFRYTSNILVKTAPLLDISAGLSELTNVKKIHIVATNNEVKELLWEIEKDYLGTIQIKTINFSTTIEVFNFDLSDNSAKANIGLPQKYIYEPNNAIMKSGGFDAISNAYGLQKLHQNSHVYTSTTLKSFPGRVFELITCFAYSKSEMKTQLANQKANISVRNFPETVKAIRKKWNIKDGGKKYCFFTNDKNDNKIVLICKKIENE
jgi:protein-L-isoaspartate O-methyltransferase